MTIRAKFFRLKSEECAALAKTMVDQFSRAELERTAAQWLRLAESGDLLDTIRLERSGRFLPQEPREQQDPHQGVWEAPADDGDARKLKSARAG